MTGMSLGILLFPHRKKEQDSIAKALAREFSDVLVETPDPADLFLRLDSGHYHLILSSLRPLGADVGRLDDGESRGEVRLDGAGTQRVGEAIRRVLDRATHTRNVDVALHESERHYRTLFENNPQPMWVFDAKTLAFLAVNEAA